MEWEEVKMLADGLLRELTVQDDDTETQVLNKEAQQRFWREIATGISVSLIAPGQIKNAWNKVLVPHLDIKPITWLDAYRMVILVGVVAFVIARGATSGRENAKDLVRATHVLRETEQLLKRERRSAN
jgi:hypothetical protein